MQLARLGKQLGCEVVLGGEGSDEWLTYAYDPRLAADLVRSLHVRALARWVRHTRSLRLPSHEEIWFLLWRHSVRPLLGTLRQHLALQPRPPSLPAWFLPDPELRKAFLERHAARREAREARARHGFYRAAVRATLDHPLHTLDKEQDYGEGQRLGIHFLSPFWDADLIAGLVRSPLLLASPDGYSKAPLRRYLQRRVPELDFASYRKTPPLQHYSATLVASARRYWPQQQSFDGLHALGLADTAQLERQTMALLENDTPEVTAAERLWRHLNVDTWVRSRLYAA
jgi:asparagine synthetase B (glutamine-hydrolysing)